MADSKSSSTGGVGFVGLLTIAFVVLKLTNVIHWSWWWVLSPLWISAALTVTILAVVGLLALVAHLIDNAQDKKAQSRHDDYIARLNNKRVGR